MLDKLKKRAGEVSTWAGLGAFISALGMLFKADGLPEAGEAITQSADSLAAGNYALPIATALSGLVAVFAPDKGNK